MVSELTMQLGKWALIHPYLVEISHIDVTKIPHEFAVGNAFTLTVYVSGS